MMGERVCKYCEHPIANDSAREFDGDWYHNGSCVKAAIKVVENELAERGLKSGDMVYIVLPAHENGKVMLEPAVLIKRIASPDAGWSQRWKVHYLRDQSGDVYEREVSPACLIRRTTGTYQHRCKLTRILKYSRPGEPRWSARRYITPLICNRAVISTLPFRSS